MAGNIRELQNIASYIKLIGDNEVTLNSLPFYILNENESFKKKLSYIQSRCNLDKVFKTIEVISNYNKSNK